MRTVFDADSRLAQRERVQSRDGAYGWDVRPAATAKWKTKKGSLKATRHAQMRFPDKMLYSAETANSEENSAGENACGVTTES